MSLKPERNVGFANGCVNVMFQGTLATGLAGTPRDSEKCPIYSRFYSQDYVQYRLHARGVKRKHTKPRCKMLERHPVDVQGSTERHQILRLFLQLPLFPSKLDWLHCAQSFQMSLHCFYYVYLTSVAFVTLVALSVTNVSFNLSRSQTCPD